MHHIALANTATLISAANNAHCRNDADMMMVCAYGKGQVPGGGMTLSEYRAHYSTWAILASPLIHGADLRTVKTDHPECFKLITNPEIVKVNQDEAALPPRLVRQNPPFPGATTAEITEQVFARPLSGNRTAVVLLNRAPAALLMHVSWKELGIGGATDRLSIFDVLLQRPLNNSSGGMGVGGYAVTVPSHDVAFVIVNSTSSL